MGHAESVIENYLVRKVKSAGGICLKFNSGVSGVPDRIVILNGQTVFVEVKAPGEKPRRLQNVRIEQMREAGAQIHVIDNREIADSLIHQLNTASVTAL